MAKEYAAADVAETMADTTDGYAWSTSSQMDALNPAAELSRNV